MKLFASCTVKHKYVVLQITCYYWPGPPTETAAYSSLSVPASLWGGSKDTKTTVTSQKLFYWRTDRLRMELNLLPELVTILCLCHLDIPIILNDLDRGQQTMAKSGPPLVFWTVNLEWFSHFWMIGKNRKNNKMLWHANTVWETKILVPLNKVLLDTATLFRSHIVYGCFCATTAALGDWDHMTYRVNETSSL